jgi:hypothetical protein
MNLKTPKELEEMQTRAKQKKRNHDELESKEFSLAGQTMHATTVLLFHTVSGLHSFGSKPPTCCHINSCKQQMLHLLDLLYNLIVIKYNALLCRICVGIVELTWIIRYKYFLVSHPHECSVLTDWM